MSAKPLVPPKSGVSKLFTMRRTVDFEAALERALAALAAAGEEVPMKGGEVVVSALVVAGLNVLAERAEGRARRGAGEVRKQSTCRDD